ncbi:MAG: N-acetylmuramoyl-L-alanine amidase-like domain-containing protein, partial [Thermodesulfobacteriota bacterium]
TTHPDLYPPLRDAANLRRMKSLERTISKRSLFFIPKKALRRLEDRIRNGDLVGITTNREGLDIEHVGIAVRVKNRIHLLHASSVMGKVILSKDTLHRYLTKSKTRSGLMLARVL